jgi:hypothetical protein
VAFQKAQRAAFCLAQPCQAQRAAFWLAQPCHVHSLSFFSVKKEKKVTVLWHRNFFSVWEARK